MSDSYLADVDRPVLGLRYEQDLTAAHSAALRLPPWFSNLLPEGRLRDWIAAERGVSAQREMELLTQVGHDLPGAVRVRPVESAAASGEWPEEFVDEPSSGSAEHRLRFSLAGVALKFSMLADGDRLTLPAVDERGDWIVKLPDRVYPDVPRNELTMMRLAAAVGIETPAVRLVHRDEVSGLPERVWPDTEQWAYAVERFDRTAEGDLVHIEDLAQVRNFYPDDKYLGSYETVGALFYRGHDAASLREFARRLTLDILISNGDAHLKNWSLIYRDERIPQISPAYDLVSTRYYMGEEELGLRFGATKHFDRVRLTDFDRLERRLGVELGLADVGRETIERVLARWPEVGESLRQNAALHADVTAGIHDRAVSLRASR